MPDMTAVWPTDQSPGNVSSEARWRKMARMWATSGVDDSPLAVAGRLAPTLAAGPIINVAAGACWVDGHYCELNPGTAIPAISDVGWRTCPIHRSAWTVVLRARSAAPR